MSELVELGQSPVGCGQPKPKAREDRHDGEKEEGLILDCEGPGTVRGPGMAILYFLIRPELFSKSQRCLMTQAPCC